MGRAPVTLPAKRGRPNSNHPSQTLTDADRKLYDLIKSKEGMGIFFTDMRRETGLQDVILKKSLKSLQSKNLIKDVPNIHSKGRKHYMAVEFEPSKEVTGGSWYSEGKLDTDLIKIMKDQCLKHIDKLKVATIEGMLEFLRRSGAFKIEFSTQQIAEIVQSLVLDNEIEEVKSTGTGDFAFVPLGKVCYRRSDRRHSVAGVMSSIPCGVCPRIRECTPDGLATCHRWALGYGT
ncbi:uncharacterized protein LOC131255653 isoform X2 [Magnolia sinica]|uniref:uncharacterized protein LOC131255653 isoform X2 n=1 Tax=Magnolia sinica TaxID=86752 RepID=UPI0026595339|nr:uncharacterized protein LOC131255653 isoform X2 [Magnolia sinica]